jgi:hypothetical protein
MSWIENGNPLRHSIAGEKTICRGRLHVAQPRRRCGTSPGVGAAPPGSSSGVAKPVNSVPKSLTSLFDAERT